ncbi:MAG TPA: choice-of-anchor D domain-containing protein, partial [Candidatus Kapabacteria bacterium]|nr:choice-of-anchor D domain-containing protein [Candidatus Kapabacteria bacterium]
MKIFTRIFIIVCIAVIPQAYAQTVSVLGDATALPSTATADWSATTQGEAYATLTAGFDLIIDSMSVSLINVSQFSQNNQNGDVGWGLYAQWTGFSLISPNGTTVTLIPLFWLGNCTYQAFSNMEIVDQGKFSLLGYPTYRGSLNGLCPDNYYKAAVELDPSVSGSFSQFAGMNARGTWQLETFAYDNFIETCCWNITGPGSPHNVTVNKWGLNFRGKYAQAQLSTTQLFASILAPLGRTVQQCITVHNVGGYALTVEDTALWSGVAPGEYQIDPNTTFPIVIQPGGSAEVCVDFTPTNIGLRTAQFTLVTNGLDVTKNPAVQQNIIITLFGTGEAPVIDAQTTNFFYQTKVLCRQNVVQYFKVHNAGNQTLTFYRFDSTHTTIEGPGYEFVNFVDPNGNTTSGAKDYTVVGNFGLTGTMQIAPGATDSIGVQFAPSQEGDRIALMNLYSNAANVTTGAGIVSRDSVGILLFGVGLAPHIDATVQDFGNVNEGDSARALMTIHNTGTGDLIFGTQRELTGNTDEFSIVSGFPTIAPDSTRTMTVQFKP